jgi:hypothetical protein
MARVAQRPDDAGHVGRPVTDVSAGEPVGLDLDEAALLTGGDAQAVVVPPRDGGAHAEPERHRQHEALVVVGVLADDVDSAWREPHPVGCMAVVYAEPGLDSGAHRSPPIARSRSTIASGETSLMNTPVADSDPARYFSLSAVRRMENSSRCR